MKKLKVISLVATACVMGTMVFGCSEASAPADNNAAETTAVTTEAAKAEEETEKAEETEAPVAEETEAKVEEADATEATEATEAEDKLTTDYVIVNDYLSYISTCSRDAENDFEIYTYVPVLSNEAFADLNLDMTVFAGNVYGDWAQWENYRSDFRVFEQGDGIVSILQTVYGVNDAIDIKAVTVNVNEGTVLSNKEVMELAGVSESQLYEGAKSSLDGLLSDYLADHGVTDEAFEEMLESEFYAGTYELMFSEDTLNSDMTMFLGPDGKLCVSSPFFSLGGALTSNEVYDLSGTIYTNIGCGYYVDGFGDIIIPQE